MLINASSLVYTAARNGDRFDHVTTNFLGSVSQMAFGLVRRRRWRFAGKLLDGATRRPDQLLFSRVCFTPAVVNTALFIIGKQIAVGSVRSVVFADVSTAVRTPSPQWSWHVSGEYIIGGIPCYNSIHVYRVRVANSISLGNDCTFFPSLVVIFRHHNII